MQASLRLIEVERTQTNHRDTALAHVEEARRFYRDLQLPKCLDALNRAEEVLRREATEEADFALLGLVFLRQAEVALALERSQDASRYLSDAAVLGQVAPSADPTVFPPEVTRGAEEARATLEARGTVVVSVRGRPEGAAVTLDGRTLGPIPLEFHVLRGQHFLRVHALGYEHKRTVVVLDRDQSLDIELVPAAQDRVAAQLLHAEDRALEGLKTDETARRALRESLGADRLILALRRPDALALTTVDLMNGEIRRDEHAADRLTSGGGDAWALPMGLVEPSAPARNESPESSTLGSPWLWVGLGVVAVGATSGYLLFRNTAPKGVIVFEP